MSTALSLKNFNYTTIETVEIYMDIYIYILIMTLRGTKPTHTNGFFRFTRKN